ncbi:hypothetical protein JCM10212_001773 [Sporobolomyces blumeae]
MRLFTTATEPPRVVLEDMGFHLVFVPTDEVDAQGVPSIGVAAYPPGTKYPFGERDAIDVVGCIGLLRYERRNLVIVVGLPLDSVGRVEEVRRIQHVEFYDLDRARPASALCKPLRRILESGHMYISKTIDLTERVIDRIDEAARRTEACQPRSRHDARDQHVPPSPHRAGVPRFDWNTKLLEPLVEFRDALDPTEQGWFDNRWFILPIVEGHYEQRVFELEDASHVNVTVTSRRGWRREGTRFEKRGINSDGNVANFAESETILETRDKTVSFVILRGSVPVFWKERPATGSISLEIASPVERSLAPFMVHFRTLVARYTNVHALSLLHSHDTRVPHPEQPLSDAYEEIVESATSEDPLLAKAVTYQQHSILHDKFDEIPASIVAAVEHLIDGMGATVANVDAKTGNLVVDREQNGIFRVNCRDCLDRTTLGQWSISKEVVLREAEALGLGQDALGQLEKALNELWAANGNALSEIYAGSPAIFNRFVRTGKYSPNEQAVEDALNTERRKMQHYLFDKEKNRSMEILTGTSKKREPQPKLVRVDIGKDGSPSVSPPPHLPLRGLVGLDDNNQPPIVLRAQALAIHGLGLKLDAQASAGRRIAMSRFEAEDLLTTIRS